MPWVWSSLLAHGMPCTCGAKRRGRGRQEEYLFLFCFYSTFNVLWHLFNIGLPCESFKCQHPSGSASSVSCAGHLVRVGGYTQCMRPRGFELHSSPSIAHKTIALTTRLCDRLPILSLDLQVHVFVHAPSRSGRPARHPGQLVLPVGSHVAGEGAPMGRCSSARVPVQAPRARIYRRRSGLKDSARACCEDGGQIHSPGIEPGSQAWEAGQMPLHYMPL